MRILRIFGVAFLTGFSGAMMPGPLLAMTIGQVSLRGWVAAPLLMVGHAVLELVVVGLLIAGVVQVLRRPAWRGVVATVGGLVLLAMGADMIRQAGALALEGAQLTPALAWPQLILAGAAISLANPTFPIWWATVGAGGMAQLAPRGAREYVSFYLGHELSDFAWYGLVGLVLVSGRNLLSPRVYGGLVLVCGLAVVALAVWFIWTGVAVLRGRRREESGAAEANMAAQFGAGSGGPSGAGRDETS